MLHLYLGMTFIHCDYAQLQSLGHLPQSWCPNHLTGLGAWKTPHQVSPKGLGQDHLLLQLLLDVLSREDHSLGEEEQRRVLREGPGREQGPSGTSSSLSWPARVPPWPPDHLTVGLVDTLSHCFHFSDETTEAQRGCMFNRNQCHLFPAASSGSLGSGSRLDRAMGVLARDAQWTFHPSDQSLPASPASRETPTPTGQFCVLAGEKARGPGAHEAVGTLCPSQVPWCPSTGRRSASPVRSVRASL